MYKLDKQHVHEWRLMLTHILNITEPLAGKDVIMSDTEILYHVIICAHKKIFVFY